MKQRIKDSQAFELLRWEAGIIRHDESYSLSTFRAFTGMGSAALREAKLKGLKIRQSGRKRYVLGKDWLSYLESLDAVTV